MNNNDNNHEIEVLRARIYMLEQMVARERALPTIYARSRADIGITAYEYKLLFVVRRALRVPVFKTAARALLRVAQYMKI